ncbi:hypothetical protein [Polaromonas jejuensis]|uniref:Secreted protein n=1 Tax=Polaromonas jejuensis TaxID=457502 RepID=A0ABW0QDC6_9BURK|nr:hypothetical protein [Polaromonas jejuensis]
MAIVRNLTLALSSLVAGVSAFAADAPAPASGGSNGVSGVTQAAVASGVLACASRINQVALFISNGNPSSAALFGNATEPDQRLTSLSMEISPRDGPSAYASASFAPNQANGCGAVYEAIVYWPQNCDTVASKQFGNAKKGPTLHKSVLTLETSGPTRIFLMPAGSGCVSIKKEVVL